MKKFQSYDQFEAEYKKEIIPEIDLEKVKASIGQFSSIGRQVSRSKRKIIVVLAAVILTMCFGTVAMALYNGWQLTNAKGEVILNFSQYDKREFGNIVNAMFVRLSSPYKEVEDETIENLAPGEMAYFMITEAYELDRDCYVLQKEEKIYDMEELRKSTTTKFKAPEYLPDSYRFEYGRVFFKEQGDLVKEGEALYQEAKKTGQEFIVKKGKLSKEAKAIWLKYVNEDGYKLTVMIGARENIKSPTADIDTIEKFMIEDQEILYVKSNPYDIDNYVFVDEDSSEKLTYVITNNGLNEVLIWDSDKTSLELTREEATKMIKSFK